MLTRGRVLVEGRDCESVGAGCWRRGPRGEMNVRRWWSAGGCGMECHAAKV